MNLETITILSAFQTPRSLGSFILSPCFNILRGSCSANKCLFLGIMYFLNLRQTWSPTGMWDKGLCDYGIFSPLLHLFKLNDSVGNCITASINVISNYENV